MSMQKVNELKAKVKTLQSEQDQAKGALDTCMGQLKEKFLCTSMKDAEAMLAELEETEDEAEKNFKKALKNFEEKWEEKL